jgi:hypothetical protein
MVLHRPVELAGLIRTWPADARAIAKFSISLTIPT